MSAKLPDPERLVQAADFLDMQADRARKDVEGFTARNNSDLIISLSKRIVDNYELGAQALRGMAVLAARRPVEVEE